MLSSRKINNQVITKQLPRSEYLSIINRAKTVLLLPNITEGFYLPALEAMYLQSLVICPDCIGNRGFCINKSTCISPAYSEESIMGAVDLSLLLKDVERNNIIETAFSFARDATLERERKIFLNLLSGLKV